MIGMAVLDLKRKLAILSDAAKYDASCASSGSVRLLDRSIATSCVHAVRGIFHP